MSTEYALTLRGRRALHISRLGIDVDEALRIAIAVEGADEQHADQVNPQGSGNAYSDNPPTNREPVCSNTEAGIVCGEKESAHTREAARGDVGMDHRFIPATLEGTYPTPR